MRRHLFASSLSLALIAALACARRSEGCARGGGDREPNARCSTSRATPGPARSLPTLPKPDADGVSGRYIYLTQLETGLGSASVLLDKSLASDARILVFRRLGKKVAAEIENPKFVAASGTADEQNDVRESFATSTIWMGDVVDTKAGRIVHGRPRGLPRPRRSRRAAGDQGRGGGGDFKFVPELSAADPNFVKLFPRNVEFSAKLTFRSDEPAAEIGNIIPDSRAFTVTLRHSLVALPEPGFVPRHDPFGYTIAQQQVDFSAPLGSALVSDLASRFRLEKSDPAAPRSPVKKPIVFYIDRGAPEPIRTALRGGRQLVEPGVRRRRVRRRVPRRNPARGRRPARRPLQCRQLGQPGDPRLVLRQPINDPRTGEIIKGSVMLGSLRARQDMMIFQALVGAGLTGTGDPNDPITATLARIRQLGAHEVGHAIGLAHNFAASSQGRYSVMDYPAPRVTLENGAPSLKDAYGAGVGPWDKWVDRLALRRENRRRGAADAGAGARAGTALRRRPGRAPGQLGQSARRLVGRRRRSRSPSSGG